TPAGNPIDEDRFVRQHWPKALRATGLRPRKFHATRHTFISCALSQGVNLKWLADYCGTSVAMIEDHYGRWLRGDDSPLQPRTAPPNAPGGPVPPVGLIRGRDLGNEARRRFGVHRCYHSRRPGCRPALQPKAHGRGVERIMGPERALDLVRASQQDARDQMVY